MIRTILIDDEPLARSLLRNYLSEAADIEIVGEYENGFEGLKAISELKPDLIFLDVQMPKLNGFEMLELTEDLPYVIFVTAYDQYAVKAFENNAVDYLLKPYDSVRLLKAVNKVSELIHSKPDSDYKLKLSDIQDQNPEILSRIAVKTGNKIKIIYVEEIQYLESQDDYVMIYTDEGKYLKQKTMKFFENNLPHQEFVRVHRSYIVRVDFVEQIELYEKNSYIIKLKNAQTIPVSKAGYSLLRKVLAIS